VFAIVAVFAPVSEPEKALLMTGPWRSLAVNPCAGSRSIETSFREESDVDGCHEDGFCGGQQRDFAASRRHT